MVITVAGVGDVEVDSGTPLSVVLAAVRAPAAVWCGGVRLDAGHRTGLRPLVHGALLATAPGAPTCAPAGAHLRLIAGPDAGGVLEPRGDGAVLGRERGVADPALSALHLALGPDGRVRDLGSCNGTMLRRAGRARRVGRAWRRLRAGDTLRAGGSVLAWTGDDADARSTPAIPRGPATLAGLTGAAAGAVTLGAVTGRWWVAAAMLAVPLAAAAVLARPRRRPASEEADGIDALAGLDLPVAIRGTPDAARSAARGLALAHGRGLGAPLAEPWMRWLGAPLPAASVVLVPHGDAAPTDAATVLDVESGALRTADRSRPWTPALVSEASADAAARRHASTRDAGLPSEVRWADLPPPGSAAAVAVSIGVGADGPVTLDLDRHGPHVLVAGTTGAGKSALLETLVGALALSHAPDRLELGLIDLKGGATLATAARLPHARGLLTDLDASDARRALLGIGHELRERKRALAQRGLASWREAAHAGSAPARLVIVVDEFQELGALDPGFVGELARLAAQGRSLGVHLVLATQRPAGAITPAIRANVGTVIALRTATAADSHDLLGDAAAASLASPGRAIVATPDGRVEMQAALALADPRGPVRILDRHPPAGRSLVEAASAAWRGRPRAAPLWLSPPTTSEEPPPGALGWVDLPARRARTALRWEAATGPLVVVGPRGSGRTTTLKTVAATIPGAVWLPADGREAARTLTLAAAGRASALVIDDVERACARLEPWMRGAEHALEDAARRLPVALACGPGWGARWSTRAGLRLVLTGLDRVEQTLWGVPTDLVALSPRPGRGVAIGAEAGECCIVPRPFDGGPRLARPLNPEAIRAGADGVVGDDARPLMLPRRDVAVAGPAAGARRVIEWLGARGIEGTLAATVGTAALTVVVAPTPSHLRALGVEAEPGVADPAPATGRVVIVHGDRAEAALLAVGEPSAG